VFGRQGAGIGGHDPVQDIFFPKGLEYAFLTRFLESAYGNTQLGPLA
jgi:hypothetical protein